MKRVVNVLGGIILAALIGLSVTACDNPAGTDTPPQVDLSGLNAAISTAQALLGATEVSADGSDVEDAAFWVTQTVHSTFSNAISEAASVRDNTASTQEQVNAAQNTLAAVREVFSAARSRAHVDLSGLNAAISAAQALRVATVVSADGSDVQADAYWATPAAHTAFYNAIGAAIGVRDSATSTQEQISAARAALVAAHEVFSAATSRAHVDLSGLNAAISVAQALRVATVVSADGLVWSSPDFLDSELSR